MPYINYVSTEAGADAQQASTGYVEYGSDKTNTVGSFPFRVDQAGNVTAKSVSTGTPGAATPQPGFQAATAFPGGFTLQNATPSIISWTAPNDGQMHRFTIYGSLFASAAMTGGAVSVTYTDPGGNLNTTTVWGGSFGVGAQAPTSKEILCKAGTTVTLTQSSALTAGAAVVWAEIWGS